MSVVMCNSRRTRFADISAGYRPLIIVLTVLVFGAGVTTSGAQSTIVIPNAGEVMTTTKVDNGVLAVNNQVIRHRSQVRECIGACFYASRTTTKTWICRQSNCVLDCSGREPVGGC